MMKSLIVKKIKIKNVRAIDLPLFLDNESVEYENIDILNWEKDFPYKPEVKFRIAYTDDKLLLHYVVKEESVRAIAKSDNGNVWEDACCECFISLKDDGTYYNMECNCAGTLLLAYGKDRHERQRADINLLKEIDRWASLGRMPFEEKMKPTRWELALVIPTKVFFENDNISLEGKRIRANFYKCGDKLHKPHFLSWNKIDVPAPDFHRPEYFGELVFSWE